MFLSWVFVEFHVYALIGCLTPLMLSIYLAQLKCRAQSENEKVHHYYYFYVFKLKIYSISDTYVCVVVPKFPIQICLGEASDFMFYKGSCHGSKIEELFPIP